MAVPNGTLNRIFVGATQGSVNLPVAYAQNWEYGQEADTTEEEFYHPVTFPPLTSVGAPKNNASYSGKWSDGEAGLQLLRSAAKTQVIIWGSFIPNSVDGEAAPFRVSRFQLTGAGVRQFAGYQFTLVDAGVAVDVGGGLD